MSRSTSKMDGSKMLSGSQLVTKVSTKKVDGQLPVVGLKDATPNGSWLEQKQIQSVLEARKQLIAVERIEKSGSLSHAAWRDDLKLAEVTKQAGGHWQYIGHKKGKYLYLLPEEALFLMETNSLLLKHNDVTVSLQKAYPLCLNEISIIQYKVYASLSRLGYRVFRHKEPIPDKSNGLEAMEENTEIIGTSIEEHTKIDQAVSMNTENSETRSAVNNDDINTEVIKSSLETIKGTTDNLTSNIVPENITESNEIATSKAISVNEKESTTANNNINTDKDADIVLDQNTIIVSDDASEQDKVKLMPTKEGISEKQDKDKTVLVTEVTTNENNTNENVTISRMDVAANGTEDSTTPDFVENAIVAEETPKTTLAAVYSIDELGVIRTYQKDAQMETDSIELNGARAEVHSTNGDPKSTDSSTNDSFNRCRVELQHYDDKINKLKEIKSNAIRKISQAIDTMQDFFKQQTVKVNVPEEKYLPRNIFLHKTDYTLNLDVVRNQNASSVRNDETDSVGSSSTQGNEVNSQRLADLPRYNYNNTQPRYPIYQHQRTPHYNPRLNFNNYFRNVPSSYNPARYHPNTFVRQHYMVYNFNMPGVNNYNNQPSRRDTIKKYHYDMIVNIAMRLKNHQATSSQIRALENLLNTYNLRYETQISMTSDFNIVGTPDNAPDSKVVGLNNKTVIALDEEPKRKKPRLNDDGAKYTSNVEKLKELARKLKELHAKNLAVSRHRRVFSNAIKTFNSKFNADLYLDSGFDIVDRKTVVVDTSSDSDAVIVKEKEKPKKRKRLRNPYSILKCLAKDVNVGASTSKQRQEVPVLRKLSLNVINDSTSQHTNNANTDSIVVNDKDEDLLNGFYASRFAGNNDFGGAKLCSKVNARLDALLFQTEYLYEVLMESSVEFESWVDIKLAIWKDIRATLNIQQQQVEAMSNDFYATDLEIQPILGPDCADLRSALKQLAIIPTNKEVPDKTSIRIHFDVCNRDVHFKKSNPPKPSFRVVCQDESAPFPSADDVVGLQAKYSDGVPTVFAFVGISGSISYVQINSIDLPVFIAGN